MKADSYIGQKFGMLRIIALGDKDMRSKRYVVCQCDCGKVKQIRLDTILLGTSRSCGCRIGRKKHERGIK